MFPVFSSGRPTLPSFLRWIGQIFTSESLSCFLFSLHSSGVLSHFSSTLRKYLFTPTLFILFHFSPSLHFPPILQFSTITPSDSCNSICCLHYPLSSVMLHLNLLPDSPPATCNRQATTHVGPREQDYATSILISVPYHGTKLWERETSWSSWQPGIKRCSHNDAVSSVSTQCIPKMLVYISVLYWNSMTIKYNEKHGTGNPQISILTT